MNEHKVTASQTNEKKYHRYGTQEVTFRLRGRKQAMALAELKRTESQAAV